MEGGLNSEVVTANACNCRLGEGCHVGQLLLVGSHRGPCFHRFDDLSCVELMPLVSRSAGLCDVGQYLQQSGADS